MCIKDSITMWQSQVFVFTVYMLLTNGNNSNAQQYSRFNGDTSRPAEATQQQRQPKQLQLGLDPWQPLTQQNNWFILQATAPSSSGSVQIQQPSEQQHRLPVNYYAYNHRYNQSETGDAGAAVSAGNYKQVQANRPEVAATPSSYVLAISQALRHQFPRPQAQGDNRRWLTEVGYKPTEPEATKAADLTAAAFAVDDNVVSAATIETASTATGDAVAVDETLSLGAYLAPFESALVKVRTFCDIVKNIISDQDDEEDELGENEQVSVTDTASDLSKLASSTSKEVQGRYSRSQATTISGKTIAQSVAVSGRKLKKLKKKFKKLLVPLLIAYKLKFLTLIPVLIGGLILLVGTTGLAGFFFALFTAVMSLKSGGVGKSIVVKKI